MRRFSLLNLKLHYQSHPRQSILLSTEREGAMSHTASFDRCRDRWNPSFCLLVTTSCFAVGNDLVMAVPADDHDSDRILQITGRRFIRPIELSNYRTVTGLGRYLRT